MGGREGGGGGGGGEGGRGGFGGDGGGEGGNVGGAGGGSGFGGGLGGSGGGSGGLGMCGGGGGSGGSYGLMPGRAHMSHLSARPQSGTAVLLFALRAALEHETHESPKRQAANGAGATQSSPHVGPSKALGAFLR